MTGASDKRVLFLLHGRDCKPLKRDLEALWIRALKAGLTRDHPELIPAFEATEVKFLYFGNVINGYYATAAKKEYDFHRDVEDRKECLTRLEQLGRDAFSKETCDALPRSDAFLAPLLDLLRRGEDPASITGLARRVPQIVLRDLEEYLNPGGYFGISIRAPLVPQLKAGLESGAKVGVIAHSLGSLAAYEVLWRFSHLEEYRGSLDNRRVGLFVALGSPLGEPAMMARLAGADRQGRLRFPVVIQDWVQVSARGDLMAFRGDPRTFFADALSTNLIRSMTLETVYNPSVRFASANPHHAAGYLTHPATSAALAGWLRT